MLRYSSLLLLVAMLPACSGTPVLTTRYVPENGFAQTLNYQFQAHVRVDADDECKSLVVNVMPLQNFGPNMTPARLRFFDDNCFSPIRFERAQYLDEDTGTVIRISDFEVVRFLSDYPRLDNELMGWLWRSEIP